MRVYELAKQHNLTSKDMMKLLEELGFPVETHMSTLSVDAVALVEKTIKNKEARKAPVPKTTEKTAEKAPEKKSFVSQRPAHTSRGRAPQRGPFIRKEEAPPAEPVVLQPLPLRAMLVFDFAAQTGKSLGDVIGSLLRQGIVVAKNQILSEELVERLARVYNIPLQTEKPAKVALVEAEPALSESVKSPIKDVIRQPIVVVMGHVDHGKTTLLDTIRKTRVAAREKGGITQHLGAYEVAVKDEKITFLDTPGHAAFSMIRTRGAHIADIAILVVAADDGVKPQTVEALLVAKAAKIPIVVAINKIDRASVAQLETVKRELAQRDLVPEEWGGQTIMVPIVAKTGQGVDALLEMIALQAQIMELGASTKAAAQGFVIESTVERGLGFVATVIVRQGIFKVGDNFICGDTEGRIVTIINSQGERIQEALPATPVLIVGFRALPQAGDEIHQVASLADRVPGKQKQDLSASVMAASGDKDEFRVIVKADNGSSLEAVVGALKKGFKGARPIRVLHQGVGLISERDITYAAEIGAVMYGLHAKWEPRAQDLAQRLKVEFHSFDIIYALLDDIAIRAQVKKAVEKISKKIGEAVVLKVFDIKKMGVIAGVIVKNGIFTRNGSVKVFRGKQEVGHGRIKSLERDRKVVKEVHSGYECAFMIDGFSDWHEGDRVECYQETSA